jgi:hypothetical protein
MLPWGAKARARSPEMSLLVNSRGALQPGTPGPPGADGFNSLHLRAAGYWAIRTAV